MENCGENIHEGIFSYAQEKSLSKLFRVIFKKLGISVSKRFLAALIFDCKNLQIQELNGIVFFFSF